MKYCKFLENVLDESGTFRFFDAGTYYEVTSEDDISYYFRMGYGIFKTDTRFVVTTSTQEETVNDEDNSAVIEHDVKVDSEVETDVEESKVVSEPTIEPIIEIKAETDTETKEKSE